MLPERQSIITTCSDSVARPIIQDSHSCDWGSNPHRSTFLFYNLFDVVYFGFLQLNLKINSYIFKSLRI